MKIIYDFLDLVTEIKDVDSTFIYANLALIALTILIAFYCHYLLIQSQRESILASLGIKSMFRGIPLIGEVYYYSRFFMLSIISVLPIYVIRLIQIVFISVPLREYIQSIVIKVTGLILKGSTSTSHITDDLMVLKFVLLLELVIVFLRFFLDTFVAIEIFDSILVAIPYGLLIAICPFVGYAVLDLMLTKSTVDNYNLNLD